MTHKAMCSVLTACLLLSLPAIGQTASTQPQRDAQAVAVVGQSITVMGGSVPSDSTASGTLAVIAGSTEETGTVRIRTRGTSQTSVSIQTPSISRATIFSNPNAKELVGAVGGRVSLELAANDQAAEFPLPYLSRVLQNTDYGLKYVGQESWNDHSTYHVQLWNSYASTNAPRLKDFSVRDVWVDARTFLPIRITYNRRGSPFEDVVANELQLSDYRSVNGVLYPFSIKHSINATPWVSIQISSVAFNTGLSDADFPTQ